MSPVSAVAAPAAAGGERIVRPEFTGSAREYFRIWIVNLFFTLITLGIYSAWAKVRKKRYFYGCTRLDGDTFDYFASPQTILKGRIVAVVLFVVYAFTVQIYPTSTYAFWAVFLLALPWLVVRALAFNEREADQYAIEMMRKAGYDPGHLAAVLKRMDSRMPGRGVPGFLSSHPPTEEREALARAGVGAPVPPGDVVQEKEEHVAEALVPDKPKRAVVDAVHRQVVTLLEQRNFDELERLLGGLQRAFEEDPGASTQLERAYFAFDRIPRTAEGVLDDWVKKQPASYAALTARASFYYFQGLEARGTGFIAETPEENIRTMRIFFEKSQLDLERSLALTQKPYLSHRTMMSIARVSGSRKSESAHYLEALKLAPQSVELRLAHITSLEPRWGGSYAAMEAYVEESRAQLRDAKAADRLAARVAAYRGHELQGKDDFAQALKHFDEAISLYPGAGTLCERAYVLGKLKRDPEAFADVKLALSKVRDHRYCLSQAVPLASRTGNSDEAIAMLSVVIEADPGSIHGFNQRAWRYQQAGKLDLAFQDNLASAKLGDGYGQLMAGKFLWAGRGVAENREEALQWLRKAAAQGHPDAKLSLQQALEQLGKK